MAVKMDIWSDMICPICYIAKRRLEKASELEGIPVDVNWRSLELDPNAPAVIPGTLAEMIAKKYGMTPEQGVASQRQLAQGMAQDNLQFNWEKARPGNTLTAHRVAQLAKKHGLGDAIEEAYFKAYMTDGEKIGDPAVIERIAISLGLPVDEVRAVIDSNQYTDVVRRDEEAAHLMGAKGVPFFVFNGQTFSGSPTVDGFRQMLRQANQAA